MARTPEVPVKFGDLPWGWGIEFKCQACNRRAGFDKNDLLLKWGEEGRVRDVAAKFACMNCRAKHPRRRPGVRIIMFKTESHTLKTLNRTPADKLARAIADFVVKQTISGDLEARADAIEPAELPENVVALRREGPEG